VVIYDEDSRINSYTGGPILDIHQVRLRNLTVAIFDFAGYLKPLKHVPMLLVGGIRAWCQLVHDTPLRPVFWNTRNVARLSSASPKPQLDKSPKVPSDIVVVERQVDDLDLAAETQWLESLSSGRYIFSTSKTDFYRNQVQIRTPPLDGWDQKKYNRTVVIAPSPSSDSYNKSILDFVSPIRAFPNRR
jgi:hypothetical protein